MQAKFNSLITIMAVLVSLAACQATKNEPITGDKFGILLMHGGFGGTQNRIRFLGWKLKRAGILVEMPLMPWGKNRAIDKSYEEAMDEIDTYVADLKKAGAKRIVIGGHSGGANAALGYAARRKDLDGIILLAYGHVPGIWGYAQKWENSTERARSMIEAGNGEKSATFSGAGRTVRGTASDIFSWLDPEGAATIWNNARLVQPSIPVLCIEGLHDRLKRCENVFLLLPGKNSNSQFTIVKSNHLGVPSASVNEVIEWLRKL